MKKKEIRKYSKTTIYLRNTQKLIVFEGQFYQISGLFPRFPSFSFFAPIPSFAVKKRRKRRTVPRYVLDTNIPYTHFHSKKQKILQTEFRLIKFGKGSFVISLNETFLAIRNILLISKPQENGLGKCSKKNECSF